MLSKPTSLIFSVVTSILLFSTACTVEKYNQDGSEISGDSIKTPNVVFIPADELRLYDLDVTGSDFYAPFIDHIANEDTVFTNDYTTSRVFRR